MRNLVLILSTMVFFSMTVSSYANSENSSRKKVYLTECNDLAEVISEFNGGIQVEYPFGEGGSYCRFKYLSGVTKYLTVIGKETRHEWLDTVSRSEIDGKELRPGMVIFNGTNYYLVKAILEDRSLYVKKLGEIAKLLEGLHEKKRADNYVSFVVTGAKKILIKPQEAESDFEVIDQCVGLGRAGLCQNDRISFMLDDKLRLEGEVVVITPANEVIVRIDGSCGISPGLAYTCKYAVIKR